MPIEARFLPVPPLFPKPLLFGLAACWVVIAGFVIATPEAEDLGPTILPPPQHSATLDNILAYHPDLEQ